MTEKGKNFINRALESLKKKKLHLLAFSLFIGFELLCLFCDGESIHELSYAPISWQYWLGTNLNGQDIFSRAALSFQNSLHRNLTTATLCLSLAVFLNLALAVPSLTPLKKSLLFLAHILDILPAYLIISCYYASIRSFPESFRFFLVLLFIPASFQSILREIESLEHSPLIQSAKQLGCTKLRIFSRYFLPQLKRLCLAEGYLLFLQLLKLEVGLSFIGLQQSSKPTLGLFIAEAYEELLGGNYKSLLFSSLLLVFLLHTLRKGVEKLNHKT